MPRGIEAARQQDSHEANFNELRKTIATESASIDSMTRESFKAMKSCTYCIYIY